jgi:proteasome lid subunit RPN8/RPN11
MLVINKDIIDKIMEQGRREAPLEACGYLAGKDEKIVKYYPMKNIDKSTDHFSLDPKEQFAVIKDVRGEGLELIAVYHTHPKSYARPSSEDIRLAYDPNIIYIIVSLLDNAVRAYRIIKGVVSEEEVI